MNKITIAIDGFSSCGKSTLAKDLASVLQYGYVDSGAMYRAVTLYFLENHISFSDSEAVATGLGHIDIQFLCKEGINQTFLNGINVENIIRQPFISDQVSLVAAIPAVRHQLVALQKQMGTSKGIVMDGRDIGTVVFPDAAVKLFITADINIRVNRRFLELREKGQQVDLEMVKKNLLERDHIDSNRSESPLKKAHDAVLIDNTNLTRKEQLAMSLALVYERIHQ